jgi:effector-binding domain-containing protein
MSLAELGIEYKSVAAAPVATVRRTFSDRGQLRAILAEVKSVVPRELIAGPGFCRFLWVTSVRDGFDGEVGFPVIHAFDNAEVRCQILPSMSVLSLMHHGPPETLRNSQRLLYGTAASLGIISDEFMCEVYPDQDNPQGQSIEIQFVVHDWIALFRKHSCRVLGHKAGACLTAGSDRLTPDSGVDARFDWVKAAMERLPSFADAHQQFDALSSSAHVYPHDQVDKLKNVFEQARRNTGDPLLAVDAVLDFMAADPGWGQRPHRDGRVIFSTKQPRDPATFAAASSKLERARAYCFCPLVRTRLEDGMPANFCNCGAGWFRQQWEGAFSRPVYVEIVESLLRGDERCTFAIHLPDDL